MSIRLRLVLWIAGLVVAMVLAQVWLIRTLAQDLEREIAEAAESVGRSVVSVIGLKVDPENKVLVTVDDRAVDQLPSVVTESPGNVQIRRKTIVVPKGDGVEYRFNTESIEVFEPGSDTDLAELITLPSESNQGSETNGSSVPIEPIQGALGDETQESVLVETVSGPHAVWVDQDGGENVFTHRFEDVLVGQIGGQKLVLRGPQFDRTVPVPTEGVAAAVARFSGRLLGGSLALALAGLLIGAVVAHRLTSPLRELASAAEEVGAGAFGTQVPERGDREVNRALRAFNQMSAQLRQLNEDAQSLRGRQHLSELGEVGRGLAHTLRNPLNALGLSIEELSALASGTAEAEQGGQEVERPSAGSRALDLAASARRQINRMDASLRAFLALGSRDSGVVTEVDLAAMAQDVALETLQDLPPASTPGRRPKISVEIEEGSSTLLCAVEPEVRAVLQALVVNAAEASPDGGAIIVRVGNRSAGDHESGIRVVVEDEGSGIAPEVRSRLFTPHVTTKPHGSGMGLYLAQRIATHRYGGSVRLDDRRVRGTRATLELRERVEVEDVIPNQPGGEAIHGVLRDA